MAKRTHATACVLAALGWASLGSTACGPQSTVPTGEPEAEAAGGAGSSAACLPATARPDKNKPQLDCAAPPNTFDVSTFFGSGLAPGPDAAEAGPTFDAWAWASFAALNWPAKPGDEATTFPTGFVRGVPNLRSSFLGAAPDDVLVWETFKEKRELFQPVGTTPGVTSASGWQDLTFASAQQPQSPSNPGGLPACTSADADRAAELLRERGHHRILAQGMKSPTADGDQTLDETVEVASQAREPSSVLCDGYDDTTDPTGEFCRTMLFPDAHLDGRIPVGPRVWKGDPSAAGARPVYYEVKVNYDFWNYILAKDLQLDANAVPAALSADADVHPKLPYRTSGKDGSSGANTFAKFEYDADTAVRAYGSIGDGRQLPPVGSIQVKAAWLMLDGTEAGGGYHTTEAIFYRSRPDPQNNAVVECYEVATFGLIALHIIQRIHPDPFDKPPGGTFVFATWEHTSLDAEPSGYYYANYLAFDGPLGTSGHFKFPVDLTPFPNFTAPDVGAIAVGRLHPYPLGTTAGVNTAVRDQLPSGSVWRNYRLIGTQFVAVGSEQDSLQFNQPFYLANLVVETNDGLQNFQGLPPGVIVTPYYTQTKGIHIEGTNVTFQRELPNVLLGQQPYNMGGCMGCHGVAQLKGYSFSFVFTDGQRGSGLDTQFHFAVAGGQLPDGGG